MSAIPPQRLGCHIRPLSRLKEAPATRRKLGLWIEMVTIKMSAHITKLQNNQIQACAAMMFLKIV
jgi:hypothetical protein